MSGRDDLGRKRYIFREALIMKKSSDNGEMLEQAVTESVRDGLGTDSTWRTH